MFVFYNDLIYKQMFMRTKLQRASCGSTIADGVSAVYSAYYRSKTLSYKNHLVRSPWVKGSYTQVSGIHILFFLGLCVHEFKNIY